MYVDCHPYTLFTHQSKSWSQEIECDSTVYVYFFMLLHEKFLQSDLLRAVVFQLNLKYYKPFVGSSIDK